MKTAEQVLRNRVIQARYRARHLELNRKRQRDYVRNLPSEKKQRRNLLGNRRKFGLTPEQYDAKLASQNNRCALCGLSFDLNEERTRPVLDHNHKTDKLRDFIHSQCNIGLGNLMDDPAICRLAAEYLERHNSEESCRGVLIGQMRSTK